MNRQRPRPVVEYAVVEYELLDWIRGLEWVLDTVEQSAPQTAARIADAVNLMADRMASHLYEHPKYTQESK